MMIDLQDCDCLLPSVFDIRPNVEFDSERRPFLFNSALISLSIILGRILKMVYSPSMSSSHFSGHEFALLSRNLFSGYYDLVECRCRPAHR